jgi:tetratricopeptide (TPR) repeat protein
MNGRRIRRCAVPIVCSAMLAAGATAADFDLTLAQVRDAARHHRYSEVIELLTPFNSVDDPEIQYITAAEIGRAHYHLGQYEQAHRAFRQAVRIHPDRVETALYLQATAYLVGDKQQALGILRELLRSGARDLYLAVTLPGEKDFLVDPEVWKLLQEYSVPFAIDLDQGTIFEVSLGEDRSSIEDILTASTGDPLSKGLSASAGPHLVWAFAFDSEQRLEEVQVHAENLLKYTPYRLRIGEHLDWSATPSAVVAVLGPPTRTSSHVDHRISMIWEHSRYQLTLEFGPPRTPRPPGIADATAMLRRLRMTRNPPSELVEIPDRIDE